MSETRENSESSLKSGNPVPRQSLKVTVHLRISSWQSDESVTTSGDTGGNWAEVTPGCKPLPSVVIGKGLYMHPFKE